MAKVRFWGLVEWASRFQTLSTIVHSEFVRNWLVPVVGTMLTGGSGVYGGIPLMWVLVASSASFMFLMFGMAGHLVLKERNSPQNKLVTKVTIHRDMTPRLSPLVGNRRQRLSQKAQHQEQMLSSTQMVIGVQRTLDKIQVGVEVTNNAFFPISVILVSADTEMEGEKPPRSNFPKPPAICQPGSSIRILDDAIPMEEFPCQRMTGKMDMLIKYGYPGNETFELPIKGGLDVQMESFGGLNSIILNL